MGSVGMEGTSEHQAREHQVPKVMAVRMPSLEIHRKWNPGGPGKAIAPRWRRVLGICPVWFRVILWNTGAISGTLPWIPESSITPVESLLR